METLLTLEMVTLVNGLAIQHSSEWEDYVEMNAQIHGLTKEEYTAYYLGTQWQMQCMESLQMLAEKKVTRKQLDKALNDVAQITNDLKKVVKEWAAARDAGKTEKQEEKLQELKKLNDEKTAAQKVVDDHIQQLDKNATLQTEDEIKIEIDGDYDIEVEKDDDEDDDEELSTESIDEKKSEFKEGDKVKLTLKGLQQMNRGRTPGISNDYSRSLGKIRQNDIVGTVERVFPSGSMNVDFDGALYDIKDYMVVKESMNEKIEVASLEDAIDAEQGGDLNKRHLDKILKRKEDGTIHQMTSSEEKTYHALLRKYKINESLSDDAYSLHRLASNVGTGTTEEFLSNHNLDIKLVANAIRQGVINKYELRDIILGKAPKSKIKSFMKEYVSEAIDIDMINTEYGFWGTMSNYEEEDSIEIAFEDAMNYLIGSHNFTQDSAYNFLNSKWGRKLADEYYDGDHYSMVDAIDAFGNKSTYKKYAKQFNEAKENTMKNLQTLESFINEATVVMDAMDPKSKILKKLLKKHKVTMKVLDPSGPSGWPEVELTGSREDLQAVLASPDGWDDPELGEYIEEASAEKLEEKIKVTKDESKENTMKNLQTLESFINEAAPKLKTSKEEAGLLKLRDEIRRSSKGGSASRYSKEFDAAKKKALKAVEDMITYAKIGV
jgi:hypothetical protein